MSTRPPSNDPADIAAWEEERARLREEKEFRDRMIDFAARTDTMLTDMRTDMQQHAAEDREKFRRVRRAHRRLAKKVSEMSGQVTQTVQTNKYNWGVAAAWVSAFVAVASVGWALIEKFGGALKP
jgi:hypothetical protein